MQKVKACIKILGILIIALIVIRFSIIEVWNADDYASTYSIEGSDGRKLIMAFKPKNHVIFYYNNNAGFEEVVVTKMRGEYGTPILGKLWWTSGNPSGIGVRWCDKGFRVVEMEVEVINKKAIGIGESPFADINDNFYSTLQFSQDRIYYAGMGLDKNTSEEGFINKLITQYNLTWEDN